MTFFLGLFRGIGKYIVLAAVGLATLFAFGKSKEVKGRRKERAKQTEKALKDATKAGEIDEDVARLSDDELDRELRVPGRNK